MWITFWDNSMFYILSNIIFILKPINTGEICLCCRKYKQEFSAIVLFVFLSCLCLVIHKYLLNRNCWINVSNVEFIFIRTFKARVLHNVIIFNILGLVNFCMRIQVQFVYLHRLYYFIRDPSFQIANSCIQSSGNVNSFI